MRTIGLDLSLTSTGIAVVRDGRIERVGNVKTKGKKTDTLEDRDKRLNQIVEGIMEAIGEFTYHFTNLVVIENPSYGSRFGSAHDRSGLWWKVAGHFLAVGIPVATVAPTARAKYLTGSGRSDKDVVLAHAIERYVVEGAPRIPNDDVADAIGLAAMGARRLGEPVLSEGEMPGANLAALDGVAWPT